MNGRPVLAAALLPVNVGVAYSGIEVPVTYSAAAVFGDALVATALGQVAPAAAAPDARSIVGRCTAPNGVAAGGTGLMRIALKKQSGRAHFLVRSGVNVNRPPRVAGGAGFEGAEGHLSDPTTRPAPLRNRVQRCWSRAHTSPVKI